MFKYQKGLTEIDGPFVIMLLLLVIAFWFAIRVATVHSELNEALTNSGIMCKPTKVNGKWYCAEGIIIKSDDGVEEHSVREIGE